MQRYVLDNGLVLWAHKGSFRRSHVILCTKAGYARDPPGKLGLAHLIEHLTIPEHLETIESLGCSVDGSTYRDYQTYECTLPVRSLPRFLEILRSHVTFSDHPDSHIEKERNALMLEGGKKLDCPSDRCEDLLNSMLEGVGSSQDELRGVKRVTRTDIQDFKSRYCVANNMVLVVVGKTDVTVVRDLAERVFGDLCTGSVPAISQLSMAGYGNKTEFVPSGLAYVAGGKYSISPEHPEFVPLECAVRTFHSIDLWTSRMFRELRLAHGLVYTPTANLEVQSAESSLLSWQVSCFPQNVGRVQSLIHGQLEDLASKGPSAAEWYRVRKAMLAELQNDICEADEYANYLLSHELHRHPLPTEYARLIRKVTQRKIRDAAGKHLVGGYHTVCVLPEQKIARPFSHCAQE
ncbi:insulinase family protein [Candidatus Woesearchaeota archaeon]|nr:insulinase family protein [Candidatus Woesearchaeota archaeon]